MMKIWIVTIYEPLPFDDPRTRPQRCGMLAKALLSGGHTVELWTSTFEHVRHFHYHRKSKRQEISDALSIQFLDGVGYKKDHSPKRLFHNLQTAREFLRVASDRPCPPDVIFAPVPSLELAEASLKYAKAHQRPVVVDVRDLWPDIYLTMFPPQLRVVLRLFFYSEILRAHRVFRNAAAITAISKSYLDWALRYAKRGVSLGDGVFHLGYISNLNLDKGEICRRSDFLRNKYKIDPRKFIVTFVGTFSNFLDVPCVLKAARALAGDDRVHFLIVGSGENGSKIMREGDALSNVTMTGWVDFIDVLSILKMTHVGLVAYSNIATMSLPNKPFEYMAAGIPLLSSLRGELEEIIKQERIGRNYKAGDFSSLVSEIRGFLENPVETQTMGKMALTVFKERFQSQSIYAKLASHLEKIARLHHTERTFNAT